MFIGGGNVQQTSDKKKLVDVLLETGKIKPDDASSWKHLSNIEVEEKLKDSHMVSGEDIARAYSAVFSIPFISLTSSNIPREVLEIIPKDLAEKYKTIVYEFDKQNKILNVATSQANRLSSDLGDVLDELRKKKGYVIKIAVTTEEDIQKIIALYSKPAEASIAEIPVKVASTLPPPPAATGKTVDLDKMNISLEVISKFPEDISRKYKMVVFEAPHPSLIKVAVVHPEDKKVQEILDFVREKNDIALDIYQADEHQISRAMKFYSPPKEEKIIAPPPSESDISPRRFMPKPAVEQAPKEPQATEPTVLPTPQPEEAPEAVVIASENDLDKFLDTPIKEVIDLEQFITGGNVPKIVAAVLALAVSQKSSDIHIEPTEKYSRVRYRVDGVLKDIIKLPLEMQPALMSRIKILSKLKIDESRVPQDGRFDAITSGHQIDLRISTLPTVHGEKVAMRILDKSLRMYTLEELGLMGRNLKILTENTDKPYGIVLAVGPTGCGKSTTLYAILNRISSASVNIITLEDPVEYEISGVNQCQIKPKIGFTFANGLRSVLRQDPNIIMVGEVRDAETASLATHAALTGHLVLTTLHTNDASGALPRLINMGIEPFLITSSINAILAQRLVRKLCPKCKRPAHIPELVQKEIDEELSKLNFPRPYQFYEGKGCSECDHGYKGRIGIFEVLPMTENIENVCIARRPSSEIKAEAIKEGMITMRQDGIIKALKGITTINEVLRAVAV
ncbi:MAG: General secretory pathway protein E [Berkelbacteria bacterium GW2011_GWB1_38_5]|uniref:General secretory pathway protein E n=1 Tax=Berkelbacteria bacterium GW2011_GWB1_38_5 TaxID=1618336 RepID=A0A0G0K6M4_9BACT|nr:MAG: General secretory pathway protein E [Berkelbacteria bacterium GW2011_GWB1_38_5]